MVEQALTQANMNTLKTYSDRGTAVKMLLVVLFTGFSFPSLAQNPFAGVRTEDTTKIPIQLGNYNYEIPANYFDTQPYTDCNQEDNLLVAVLPDLEGRNAANSRVIDASVGQDSKRITMLLSADRDRRDNALKSLKIWADIIEDNYGPFKKAEYPWYGLEYRYHTGKREANSTKDQFRFYNKDMLATQIECRVIGSVPNPTCNHSFAVNDLRVRINYPLSRLREWKTIEDKARALIKNWTKSRAESLKSICKE